MNPYLNAKRGLAPVGNLRDFSKLTPTYQVKHDEFKSKKLPKGRYYIDRVGDFVNIHKIG